MCFGEAADLVVREARGFARGHHIDFADVLLALRIDHPDRAIWLDGSLKQLYAF